MLTPLHHIPTHLLVGPLGAGKTSVLSALMAQKPPRERWAVLVNEFGSVGLDAALLSREHSEIVVAELAGGCLCCATGVPFQTTLTQLLRQTRPDRLLIELSGLGHPVPLVRQLLQPPWLDVLRVQPLMAVLDAGRLSAYKNTDWMRPELKAWVGLWVLNKAEQLLLDQSSPIFKDDLPHYQTCFGQLPWALVPQADVSLGRSAALFREGKDSSHQLDTPSTGYWSLGWQWSAEQRWDRKKLEDSLAALPWIRAKLIIHTPEGWYSANAVAGAAWGFTPSEWRKDTRLELIFAQPYPKDSVLALIQQALLV